MSVLVNPFHVTIGRKEAVDQSIGVDSRSISEGDSVVVVLTAGVGGTRCTTNEGKSITVLPPPPVSPIDIDLPYFDVSGTKIDSTVLLKISTGKFHTVSEPLSTPFFGIVLVGSLNIKG